MKKMPKKDLKFDKNVPAYFLSLLNLREYPKDEVLMKFWEFLSLYIGQNRILLVKIDGGG